MAKASPGCPTRSPTTRLTTGSLEATGAEDAVTELGAGSGLYSPGLFDTYRRVWFRHAKAGELCEHVNELHLVRGGEVVEAVPTYRGEGRSFV